MNSTGPRLQRANTASPATRTAAGTRVKVAPTASQTAMRSLLHETHDGPGLVDLPTNPHVDDGPRDSDLPELLWTDDLDTDDPERKQHPPRAGVTPLPKIRWWLDASDQIHWGTRTPTAGRGAVNRWAMARHAVVLDALARTIATTPQLQRAVRAPGMWEALLAFRETPAVNLLDQVMGREPTTDGTNLSHLRSTVVAFPWGLTNLGTLTSLAPRGRSVPAIELALEVARLMADPEHPERLTVDADKRVLAELTGLARAAAERSGLQADSGRRLLPELHRQLRGILARPAAVWSLRSTLVDDWHAATLALSPGKEYITVMAVAGAFDDMLVPRWHAIREEGT